MDWNEAWKNGKRIAAIAMIAAVITAGCAAIRNMKAQQTEEILAAAGFQMKLADTPEKLARLQALRQQKLVPHQRDGEVYYVYADAGGCKCIYVGNETAYQQYQKLALEEKIADEQREAASMNEAAAMDWNTWGPWGPWGP